MNTPSHPAFRPLRPMAALVAALCCAGMSACVSPPSPEYPDTAPILEKRQELKETLLSMLPEAQRKLPAAQEEARWLADTAYKAAAGIARVNRPILIGWLNNYLVNSPVHFKERGLCWHYQNDMYRELRRRPLKFFRIGCCVRDQGKRREHHCIYLCPEGNEWPHVHILDAWRYHGKLKTIAEADFMEDDWKEEGNACHELSNYYPEGHSYPIEHWAKVRSDYKWSVYVPSCTEEGQTNRQGKIMLENVRRGLQERNGKLTNY